MAMLAERNFRIYWGPTLENALDFVSPVVGSNPLFYRAPRDGATQAVTGTDTIAWIPQMHYRMQVTAQYFKPTQWAGGVGLQAFLDWAADSNAFTLVPNINTPALTVTGCYLDSAFGDFGTFGGAITLNPDGSQTVALTILNADIDLNLAWRGLFFEYATGQSLTDPIAYTYSRASVGYEINWQGYLNQNASGTICDGHYANPLTGIQGTLLEDSVTNDITSPEDLTAVAWSKSETTITANVAKAPNNALTADLVVESVTVSAIHAVAQSVAITALDPQAALVFIRPAGRFNVLFGLNDAANGSGGNKAMMQINLHTGVMSAVNLGTGVVQGFTAVDLANGWWMLYVRGSLGGAITTSWISVRLGDGSGNFTYTGDGASGIYVWGMTAVHAARKQVGCYTPTTSVNDSLTVPWAPVPQAQWDYAKFTDWCPDTDAAQTYSVFQTGDTAFTAPRAYIVKNSNSFTALHANGVGSASSTVSGLTINPGDTVEVMRIMDATGAVTLRVSVNGGAEQVGTTSAALAFAAAWNAQILSIGAVSTLRYTYALQRLKSGPYVASGDGAVTTIAQARAT